LEEDQSSKHTKAYAGTRFFHETI